MSRESLTFQCRVMVENGISRQSNAFLFDIFGQGLSTAHEKYLLVRNPIILHEMRNLVCCRRWLSLHIKRILCLFAIKLHTNIIKNKNVGI